MKDVRFLCMAVSKWENCVTEAGGRVYMDTGSVGFCEVFDDVDKLKFAYPDADIMKVTKVEP